MFSKVISSKDTWPQVLFPISVKWGCIEKIKTCLSTVICVLVVCIIVEQVLDMIRDLNSGLESIIIKYNFHNDCGSNT